MVRCILFDYHDLLIQLGACSNHRTGEHLFERIISIFETMAPLQDLILVWSHANQLTPCGFLTPFLRLFFGNILNCRETVCKVRCISLGDGLNARTIRIL